MDEFQQEEDELAEMVSGQGSVHGLLLAAEDGSQLNWEPARDAQLEGLPLLDVCVLGHSPFDNANADSAFAMNNEWL